MEPGQGKSGDGQSVCGTPYTQLRKSHIQIKQDLPISDTLFFVPI